MTAPFLISELTTLVSESKRKAPELRTAAEKSLSDLKALPVTSDIQLSTDLSRRPHFPQPFFLACSSKNGKLALIGLACLQRLVITHAVPRERLRDLVQSLKECSSLGLDQQLKVLQILPILTSTYSEDVKGDLLFALVQVCSTLQASKTAALSSTAAATLQQLVLSIFEKLYDEDRRDLELPTVAEVPGPRSSTIAVRSVAYDAFRILEDLCGMIAGASAKNLKVASISDTVLLELIEAILLNHADCIHTHPEQENVLRVSLLPVITQILREKQTFAVVVRAARITCIVMRSYYDLFQQEVNTSFATVNKLLDLDASQHWRRALALEILRAVVSDHRLITATAKSDQNKSLQDCFNSFVRLASEKPAVIGLGQHSSLPIGNYFQRESGEGKASVENGALSALAAGVPSAAVPGISTQWSSVKTACLDNLDKTDPPTLPETYVYSLVVQCLNGAIEGLSKFVIPLTVAQSGKSKKRTKAVDPASTAEETPSNVDKIEDRTNGGLKRSQSFRTATIPINPLDQSSHPAFDDIKVVAALIQQIWPAILACCSTFLYAALDNDFYRMLIRLYQKFTQSIGLLRMSTPRDAFLTTLGKAAVPASVLTAALSPLPGKTTQSIEARGMPNVEAIVSQAAGLLSDLTLTRRTSVEGNEPLLNVRNLLCLRALLNLAIALGPTLEKSWSIIYDTLRQADNVIAVSTYRPVSRDRASAEAGADTSSTNAVATEIGAVQAASARMIESTCDYPNEVFKDSLEALCKLLLGDKPPETPLSPTLTSPKRNRRQASFSGISIRTEAHERDPFFALTKIRDMSLLNIERFITFEPTVSGWDVLVAHLISFATDENPDSAARSLATEIIANLSQALFTREESDQSIVSDKLTRQALDALRQLCDNVQMVEAPMIPGPSSEARITIHATCLRAFHAILERTGDSLNLSWPLAFQIICSVFSKRSLTIAEEPDDEERPQASTPELSRLAFACLQLICSDFLTSIPESMLDELVSTLALFAAQDGDLNVALTTSSALWAMSDYLYTRVNIQDLEALTSDPQRSSSVLLSDTSQAHATESSLEALWLRSLKHLTTRGLDSRVEVRNSAIQAALRIFDSYGSDFSPNVWICCLRLLWLPLMVNLHGRYQQVLRAIRSTKSSATAADELCNSLISSARIVFGGIGKMSADFAPKCESHPGMPNTWMEITNTSVDFLRLDVFDISATVFDALSAQLTASSTDSTVAKDFASLVLDAWLNNAPGPVQGKSLGRSNASNTKCLEAYVKLLPAIHRLRPIHADLPNLTRAFTNFYECIVSFSEPTYGSASDTLSPLQALTMQNVELITTDERNAEIVCRFVAMSTCLSLPRPGQESKRLSVNGFSKALIDYVERLVQRHATVPSFSQSQALDEVLQTLVQLIRQKSEPSPRGKSPYLWQKATTTIVAIAEAIVPVIGAIKDRTLLEERCGVLVAAAQAIITNDQVIDQRDRTAFDQYLEDEVFDTQAFEQLHQLLVNTLGSPLVSDTLRRKYAYILFTGSMIHLEQLADVESAVTEPLQGLYNIRHGRVTPQSYTLRMGIAYSCLERLFNMVTLQSSTLEQVSLGHIAAPFLLLRSALPLKAYIADQPLRSRAPLPSSAAYELQFILKHLTAMKSEPRALPGVASARSTYKKHVLVLFPLLTKALGVARYDVRMMDALRGCLDSVNNEFGGP